MIKIIRYSLILTFVLFLALVLERTTLPRTTDEMRTQAQSVALNHSENIPPNPFTYDGCSLWPDRLPGHDLAVACFQHDIAYWIGGSNEEKEAADQALREKVTETGPLGSVIAWVMYIGVSLFGDSVITHIFNANWGFGWNE